jgi:hypothetical protein
MQLTELYRRLAVSRVRRPHHQRGPYQLWRYCITSWAHRAAHCQGASSIRESDERTRCTEARDPHAHRLYAHLWWCHGITLRALLQCCCTEARDPHAHRMCARCQNIPLDHALTAAAMLLPRGARSACTSYVRADLWCASQNHVPGAVAMQGRYTMDAAATERTLART